MDESLATYIQGSSGLGPELAGQLNRFVCDFLVNSPGSA